MSTVPRLSIGLPVYNGEEYLAESLDALLGQSYEDFELVITDNASTDGTEDDLPPVREAGLPDPLRAAAEEHRRRGRTTTTASRWPAASCSSGPRTTTCTAATCCSAASRRSTSDPRSVLAHSWNAIIDDNGTVIEPTSTSSPPTRRRAAGTVPQPAVRAGRRRLLRRHAHRHAAPGPPARQLPPRGPHVRHGDRHARAVPPGARAAVLPPRPPDPRRAGEPDRAQPVRQPGPAARATGCGTRPSRLLAEYVLGFVGLIRRAPISAAEKRKCYRYLAEWLSSRVRARPVNADSEPAAAPDVPLLSHRRRSSPGRGGVVSRACSGSRRAVGLFGLLGSGNIGNDGSLEAVLDLPA